MKKQILLMGAIAFLNLSCQTPNDQNLSTSNSATENEEDRRINQDVSQALMADEQLSKDAKNIHISVSNGVVLLSGEVTSGKENDLILTKVGKIKGIKRIDNQLTYKKS